MGFDIVTAKDLAFWFAYILGVISPNKTNKVVIATTWIKNSINEPFSKEKTWLVKYTDKTTIAILIRLLAIKIVANKRFG